MKKKQCNAFYDPCPQCMTWARVIKLILHSDTVLSEDEIGNFMQIFHHIESKRSN